MTGIIIAIHIIACVFLILIVLLQTGKGAEIGAAFGGSSQTLFGPRGAGTILSKLTVIAAVVFMITSISLSYLRGTERRSRIAEPEVAPVQEEIPSPLPVPPVSDPGTEGQKE